MTRAPMTRAVTRTRETDPRVRDASAAQFQPRQAINWEDLRVALAISRSGSIARAAEALLVDPATISRRLAALESSLGAILFVRARTGMTPTDEGAAVLSRAHEMELRAMRLEEDIAQSRQARGVVCLAGCPWTMVQVASCVAPLLHERHDAIELRLVAARPPVDPSGEQPLLGLWFEMQPSAGEFVVPLGDVAYATYRSASATRQGCRLVHRNEDGAAREPDSLTQAGRRPGEVFPLSATDSLMLREAVAAGLGSALLPEPLAARDSRLVRVDGAPALRRTLGLHVHPDTIQAARVQALIGCLRDRFDSAFGAGE